MWPTSCSCHGDWKLSRRCSSFDGILACCRTGRGLRPSCLGSGRLCTKAPCTMPRHPQCFNIASCRLAPLCTGGKSAAVQPADQPQSLKCLLINAKHDRSKSVAERNRHSYRFWASELQIMLAAQIKRHRQGVLCRNQERYGPVYAARALIAAMRNTLPMGTTVSITSRESLADATVCTRHTHSLCSALIG